MTLIGYYIERFLYRLGVGEMKAVHFHSKWNSFEDWLLRHPISVLMITFDPDFDDSYHKYSITFDEVKFHHSTGRWQKHLTFVGKAKRIDKDES